MIHIPFFRLAFFFDGGGDTPPPVIINQTSEPNPAPIIPPDVTKETEDLKKKTEQILGRKRKRRGLLVSDESWFNRASGEPKQLLGE